MAVGASVRSATLGMGVSRVGVCDLTLPERWSLSTSPWDLEPTGRARRRTIHQHVHHLATLQVNDDRPVVGALPPRPVIDASHWTATTALLSDRALACFLRPARIVVSLTGIPSGLISRSEGRPPAPWPSSRTIPARRAVRRANGAARLGTRSVKMRRSHRWLRHLHPPRWALTMTGAP
jgi:hypothetical protein